MRTDDSHSRKIQRRRRYRPGTLAVGVLTGVGIAVAVFVSIGLAGGGANEAMGPVERQAVAWTTGEGATESTEWREMIYPGISIDAKGPMTVLVSTSMEENAADVRVRSGRLRFHPGPVRFEPGDASSASFVSRGSKRARCHTVKVEWRSPTGAPARFDGGSVSVLYNHARVTDACF